MIARRLLCAALLTTLAGAAHADNVVASTTVIDMNRVFEPNYLSSYLSNLSVIRSGANNYLRVSMNGIWAGIWQHRDTPMNWTNWDSFKITLQNQSARTVELTFKVDGAPLGTDPNKVGAVTFFLPAKATVTYVVDLNPETPAQYGFHAMPPAIDTPHVRLFMIKKVNLPTVYRWSLYQRENVVSPVLVSNVQLLKHNNIVTGIVDTFGQYSGGSWLGKALNVGTLSTQLSNEQIDLANNPGPGMLKGSTTQPPLLAPSNRWKTAQTGSGKWYLVHPSGRRFWSFGVTGINWVNDTVLTGREFMFQNLPPRDVTYGQFYGVRNGKNTFDFTSANLYRKFGADYKTDFVQHSAARLKSWGMNTAGAWSLPMESQNEVPYAMARNTRDFPTRLNTAFAYWMKLPDAFDAGFQPWLTSYFTHELATHNGKENFMGIFVDNELSWGSWNNTPPERYQVGIGALNSAATQPAKIEYLRQLKAKYVTIQALNTAWGTSYASWLSMEAPNSFTIANNMNAACQDDMKAYVFSFASAYYGKVRAALTAAGNTGLYLGARESWPTVESTQAAMGYVDVYSVTKYQFADKIDWSFPESTKPVFISEFSFGSNDRGGFNPGFGCVIDQLSRAGAMRDYVNAALQAPKVVGAHWFQYYEQPVSGRAQDGETYAIGLVSITDNAYPEMVKISRELGQNMYSVRGL